MNHLPAPKKQTQFKPNFFKGQNELKENLATPYVFDCKEISCTYGGILALTAEIEYNNLKRDAGYSRKW